MVFKEKLLELRKQKGWSQEELGNSLDVSRQTISKWESGQSTPEMEKLVKISEIFDISLDDLIKGIKIEADRKQSIEKPKNDSKTQNKQTNIETKKIILIILAILVAVLFVIFTATVIFRMVKLNIIADKIEVLWDNTGKMNYRIDEIYTISNIDIAKIKDSYNREYYSFGLDKMMMPRNQELDTVTYVSLEQGNVQEFNHETKEYTETPLLEYDSSKVEDIANKHIQIYRLITENIKMRSFKDKLKIALDFSYKISIKGLGFTVEKNNVMYSLGISVDDKIIFTRTFYDEQNRVNYEAYYYTITLDIVKDYMMQKPDINEYTKVE